MNQTINLETLKAECLDCGNIQTFTRDAKDHFEDAGNGGIMLRDKIHFKNFLQCHKCSGIGLKIIE